MTIQSSDDDRSVMFLKVLTPEIRRARILEIITRQGEASVEALAELVGASRETIRRDLAMLDASGEIRKFHGGGRLALPEASGEGPYRERMLENVVAKRAIARHAAALFAEGSSLFVDAGSTTFYFAEALAQRSGMVVITNSTAIGGVLARDGRHKVFTLGGAFCEATSSCLGSMTVAQAMLFSPDHAVLTAGAVTDTGFSDHDEDEAELARVMVAQATRLTVLADHSKFDRAGLFPVAEADMIDRLVTNTGSPTALVERLRSRGVEVCIAEL